MSNIFNEDFIEFIDCLNRHEVSYILVGGYSVIIHGNSRTTGDMDVWVKRDEVNYEKLMVAFLDFGLPTSAIPKNDFLNNENIDVFTFGRPPVSIDIMTSVKGLEYEETFRMSFFYQITNEISVRVIHKNHLVQAKISSARPKDLDDLNNLS